MAETHTFAPLFVVHRLNRAPESALRAVLADARWPRWGVVFRHQPEVRDLPGGHVVRGLGDFLIQDDHGEDVFDRLALSRVLRGFVTPSDHPEPRQFLQGNRLKLPHFPTSVELSDERAKIIRILWGVDGYPPPVMSWTQVNTQAATGYQSFDDAFDQHCPCPRREVIERVGYGKYRLRRDP